jgi:voltage-gated potassium channel
VKERAPWRSALHRVIFGAETPAGRWFDVILIFSILASVAVVMLDSIQAVQAAHGRLLNGLEWVFTFLFTAEYVLRLLCSPRPRRYATSFFGTVDLVSILPTYLAVLFPAGRFFVVLRILRILRVFRVLKLVQYVGEANVLRRALWASRRKIIVFLFALLTLVVVLGSLMYVIEGEANGFTSIPRSVYWAVVTLTTVGYGDISPQTSPGQMLAAVIMIMGYSIIAVPTGIVTAEMSNAVRVKAGFLRCPGCGAGGHDGDAGHCKFCGTALGSSRDREKGMSE